MARNVNDDPTRPFLPGDARPEDIPNPDPTPSVFPGDADIPATEHATSGFSDVANFGGPTAFHAVPGKKSKDTSAMRAGTVTADPVVEEYNSGEATGLVQTRESGARDYNAFSVTLTVGVGGFYPGAPVMLLGDDSNRARVQVSNTHAADVILVGPLDQVNSGAGFAIPAGRIVELQVQGAIYACLPAAGVNPVLVGVLVEMN